MESGTTPDPDLQAQMDAVIRQVTANRKDIDALIGRADAAEAQSLVDREMIAELQRDGLLSHEHAAQLEEALKSSRVIGTAIGIIMNSRDATEDQAFQVLRKTSQDSNRKLRELAAEVVSSQLG